MKMEHIEDTDYVASEHDRLVSAIRKLDKSQHITEPTRNEPTNLNSEFNLIKKNKLNLSNITRVLENTSHHVQISKKLKKTQDESKILSRPLEKPQAELIKRAIGYEETKKRVGRWDPVVASSHTVDHVSFPLNHVSTKLQPTGEFLSKLQFKSDLEKELDELNPPLIAENEDEGEQVFPMSYEEMVEHRQHLAKIRAQQSYKAAKGKRQSKIKSKKYHRVLKKEKLKQQLKEFKELQKKHPKEALKELESLEKDRALERHTLRHKNTGKWAKNKLIRAKYDKEVRQELAEQLAVSRSITQKIPKFECSSDEDEELIEITAASNIEKSAQMPVKSCTYTNIDSTELIIIKPKHLINKYDQLDDEEQVVPKVDMEEVFEDDDIVDSFRQEKEDKMCKDKFENTKLKLLGWGAWVGKGVKPQKRKKNRFIVKAPVKMPRRDENKGDIIIREFKDPKLACHKVKDVLFPFERVKDYEASIRTPLGNTFITEKAFKKLICPSVITKAGTVIDPMDEQELLVPKNRNLKNAAVLKILGHKK